MSNKPDTVVLINGLWMTALGCENWVKYHTEKGYRVIARSWSGTEIDLEEIRRGPSPMACREPREFVSRRQLVLPEPQRFEELNKWQSRCKVRITQDDRPNLER